MMGLSSEIDNLTACIMVFSWGNRNTGLAALLADVFVMVVDAVGVAVDAAGVAVGARGVAINGVVSDAGF